MLNRKSQLGQTITWVAATIIIIFIIILFLFAVTTLSTFGQAKSLLGRLAIYENSGIAEQQMLIAILYKNDGEILNLIKEGKTSSAQELANDILNNFKEQGIDCSFKFSGAGFKIGDLEVSLEC